MMKALEAFNEAMEEMARVMEEAVVEIARFIEVWEAGLSAALEDTPLTVLPWPTPWYVKIARG